MSGSSGITMGTESEGADNCLSTGFECAVKVLPYDFLIVQVGDHEVGEGQVEIIVRRGEFLRTLDEV
jgi:hypothetical protein